MHSHEFYVRVDGDVGPGRRDEVRIVVEPGQGAAAVDSFEVGLDPWDPVGSVAHALRVSEQASALGLAHSLLVDVRVEALRGAAWEGLGALVGSSMPVVRYRPGLAALSLQPFTLPVDVLVADLTVGSGGEDLSGRSVPEAAQRYMRTVVVGRATTDRLSSLMSGMTFEIVHLRGRFRGRGPLGGDPVLLDAEDAPIDLDALRSWLSAAQTRLVVLEDLTEGVEVPPLGARSGVLDLAYELLDASGPTVLTLASEDPVLRRGFADEFYLAVVHDQSLDWAVHTSAQQSRVAACLLRCDGGDEILRLSPLAPSLLNRAASWADATRRSIEDAPRSLTSLAPELRRPVEDRVARLRAIAGDLEEMSQTAFAFTHETGGLVPMTDLEARIRSIERDLPQDVPDTRRHLNTWIGRTDSPVPASTALVSGQEYVLNVSIGPRVPWSVIGAGSPSFPDDALAPYQGPDGVTLDVEIFTDDFEVPTPHHVLVLPPPPAATPAVQVPIRVTAPPGQGRLRVAVYYHGNLLQSAVVTAAIAQVEGTAGEVVGTIDFQLSGTLRDVTRLAPREVNILTNDGPGDEHTFAIVGTGLRTSFPLSDAVMRSGITAARTGIQHVCGTPNGGGRRPGYRFKSDNSGGIQQLTADLLDLAAVGYSLFTNLVVKHNPAFQDELTQALGCAATIQIAGASSATYVFPWALVYDYPFVRYNAGNTLCRSFLEGWRAGGPEGWSDTLACFTAGCPDADDESVVCPSGFWGFKHVIEQPISTLPATTPDSPTGQGAAAVPPAGGDLVTEIVTAGSPKALLAISQDLRELSAHRPEVTAAVASWQEKSSLFEIGRALKTTDLHLIYFYCHGGRDGARPWLGVGKSEQLFPDNLNAWRVRWPGPHPLVVINGCETVGLTPDDLLGFNAMLSRCQAAGVVGTEISVPETLARYMGAGLLQRFAQGQPVGSVLHRLRRNLLERGNPLGLAYTAYCSADLHLTLT